MGPNAQDAAARAKQLVSERKYQDAVRACRRLLLSKPDHVDVRVLLGQALLALGRHDEVRIEMQALLKKAPLVAPAHRLLGEAYLRARQSDNAASALREALRLDPEDEEARELLEELGEVEDEMPPMETIERWFPDEPTRVEAAETPDAPATSPATDAPPSVELSDDLRAEITRTNEAKAPPPRAPKKTLMGLAIPAPPKVRGPLPSPTSPAIVSPPKPSVPPPPPGRSKPSAPPPPSSSSGSVVAPPPVRPPRAPKSTLLGFSAVPAPVPAPAPRPLASPAPIPATAPRPLGSPAPAPTSAPSLASADLISADSEELLSAELLAPSTGDLELAELTTGSEELERLVPKVRPDPYEHLAQEPPPLEGEATDARRPLGEDDLEEDDELPGEPTRARPPVLDGVSEEQDLFGAGLPELEAEPTRARAPVDFEDETTKGREESALDVATTTRAAAVDDGTSQRPRVEGFPSDALPTDGLPELAGEPTLAKPTPEGPQPVGFSPSAAPGGFSPSAAPGGFSPSAAPGGAPSGFAPSAMPSGFAPSGSPGSGAPAGVLPGSTPSSTSTERPSVKVPSSGSGNVEALSSGEALSSSEAAAGGTRLVRIARWTLPLPTAIALAGVPVLVVVLVVFGVRVWLAGRAEDAIAEAT
ncbi:MAG: tetratricopeptide repeat protein, partial [Myxococcales bacterium]|nr:tetratricopeptide repeat protein [Myxococcales bacterium]